MALTRKLLKGMGLTDEQVDTIIEAHTDTVDGLKADVSKYKTDAEKLSDVQKELDELKAKGDDGWKEKYDNLKGEFDKYKTDVQEKETHNKKVEAYKAILKDANLSEKGIEKAVKYADWDKIELDEDGKLKGANDHIKAVRDEWAEYVTTTAITGARTSTPPANNGGAKLTKAEIYAKDDHGRYKLSTAERQKALAENPDLLN